MSDWVTQWLFIQPLVNPWSSHSWKMPREYFDFGQVQDGIKNSFIKMNAEFRAWCLTYLQACQRCLGVGGWSVQGRRDVLVTKRCGSASSAGRRKTRPVCASLAPPSRWGCEERRAVIIKFLVTFVRSQNQLYWPTFIYLHCNRNWIRPRYSSDIL